MPPADLLRQTGRHQSVSDNLSLYYFSCRCAEKGTAVFQTCSVLLIFSRTGMKQAGLLVLPLALTLAGCDSDEKKAGELYRRAETSFARGEYSQAKLQIDSIRSLYPKAIWAVGWRCPLGWRDNV